MVHDHNPALRCPCPRERHRPRRCRTAPGRRRPPGPLHRPDSHPHRVRPSCLPDLVHSTGHVPVDRPPGARRAVRAVDAGDPPEQPSTISRRLSVVIGFYRTAVIDGVLTASPADHVRRPHVPAESPTLGLSHLQFEAMLQAGRASVNINNFALVTMLGLLGLRIFEACGANIQDLREEHGHRVLKVRGKGGKVVLTPLPSAVQRAIERAVDHREDGPILRNRQGGRMDRHAATRRLHHLADEAGINLPRMHPHMLRHTFVTTMLDAGVDLRDVQIAARHADPRTTMRYDRARKNLDRHPNYILAAYMASGT
nr:tyrosine-type recombinase/integrase [Ornithinimicrobium sediminis]